jgi:lipid-binding SYLF domain-containing protein
MTMNPYASNVMGGVLVSLTLTWAGLAAARSDAEVDANTQATLQSFTQRAPGNGELLNKAAAVLVFPNVTKAAIGIGGRHGDGELLVNGKIVNRYALSGASIGASLGISEHSEIILFMTPEAASKFEHSHGWTLDAEAGAALPAHGADAEYDSETLRRPVISIVWGEHGLIGDLSLEGSKITPIHG